MKLTEMAQKKRGQDSNPANANMTGRDSVRGLKGRVASTRANRPPQSSLGPSQATMERWQRSIEGQARDLERQYQPVVAAPGVQAQSRAQVLAATGTAAHKRQYAAIRGRMTKVKKAYRPHGYF